MRDLGEHSATDAALQDAQLFTKTNVIPVSTGVAAARDRWYSPQPSCGEERVDRLEVKLSLPEIHPCPIRSHFGMAGFWKSVFATLLRVTRLEDKERMTGQCECTCGQQNRGLAV